MNKFMFKTNLYIDFHDLPTILISNTIYNAFCFVIHFCFNLLLIFIVLHYLRHFYTVSIDLNFYSVKSILRDKNFLLRTFSYLRVE